MFSKEKLKAVQEAEAKFQAEKKQLEIEKLEKEDQLKDKKLKLKEAENKKQRLLIIIFIIVFLFIIAVLMILYRLFKQKKTANYLLEQKNSEITAQRDEIEAQRDLISNQKKDIVDSIQYANKIQSAIFPEPEDLKLALNEYFVFYKPRDIVSGDFYWINKQKNKTVILAADCTGHGVPGAFMSMLGIAFLNEIVNKENITEPATILDKLRENVILALKQKAGREIRGDGMDVGVVTIDKTNNILSFAGANNPMYFITDNDKLSTEGNSNIEDRVKKPLKENEKNLFEIKGDSMPVGAYYDMDRFKQVKIKIKKGDLFYLFSDGYADQFGGPKGKKFKYKPFKKMILSKSNLPMEEQKSQIINTHINWIETSEQSKYPLEQVDDILVVGVKIT